MEAPTAYVFGYGSLIQANSRLRNLKSTQPPVPVRVHGFRRGWITRGRDIGFSCTYLGIVPDRSATTNGVLLAYEPEEIPALDQRESEYRRVPVELGQIELLGDTTAIDLATAEVITYQTLEPREATEKFPLVQSYIDICLQGCLEVDRLLDTADAFASEFLASTDSWSHHWVNDRVFPRSPFRQVPEAHQIDKLLQHRSPAEFASIRIE
ncbi:gamma-glutamylcyclotransferase family protein [Aeoliella mucimassa]|nr:gamma-glutamylcyclotransferase family protein [Aeoliella mucimassa]